MLWSFIREAFHEISKLAVAGLLIFLTSLTPDELVQHAAKVARGHADEMVLLWDTWLSQVLAIAGLGILLVNFSRDRYLLLRRRFLLYIRLAWALIFHRSAKFETRMAPCHNPHVLHATLLKAVGNTLSSDGISSARTFRRWTKNGNVIFRVWERVLVWDGISTSKLDKSWGEPKGFYSIYPLRERAFIELKGSVLDYDAIDGADLSNYANRTTNGLEKVWLLILDLEVTKRDRTNRVPTYLLMDLLATARRIVQNHANVAGISALAATPAGKNIAPQWGFPEVESYATGKTGEEIWELHYIARKELGTMIKLLDQSLLDRVDSHVTSRYTITQEVTDLFREAQMSFRESIRSWVKKKKKAPTS